MKNPFDFFDGITVINLDKDISKWVRFVDQTEKYGFADKVVRITGVYHKNGAYGCAVAHKHCLDTARQRGWNNVLIMEDDVKFLYNPSYITEAVSGAVSRLKKKKSWDLFYMGLSMREFLFDNTDSHTAGDIIKSDRKWFGRFAYAVNNTAFDVFDGIPEEDVFTNYNRGDVLLERRKDLNKYVMWPAIASVSGDESCTDPGKIKDVARFIEDGYTRFKMADLSKISDGPVTGGDCIILAGITAEKSESDTRNMLSITSGYSDIRVLCLPSNVLSGFFSGVTAARNRLVNLSGIRDLLPRSGLSRGSCQEGSIVILLDTEYPLCSGYVTFLRKQVSACPTGVITLVTRSGVVSGLAVRLSALLEQYPGAAAGCSIPESLVYAKGY